MTTRDQFPIQNRRPSNQWYRTSFVRENQERKKDRLEYERCQRIFNEIFEEGSLSVNATQYKEMCKKKAVLNKC